MDDSKIKLILVDPNSSLCEEFRLLFDDFGDVEVECGLFQQLPVFDCMVSAGNSFGLMDGGVDLAIVKHFGIELMDRVQKHILDRYRGEQPVGTSFIVPTDDDQHPFLAHTPTMRFPMKISATDNVYQAMWAMLLAVWQHNQNSDSKIKTVACPGLGTAAGGVPVKSAAQQMSLAYGNFLDPPASLDWNFAASRQKAIGLGGNDGFQALLDEWAP